MELITSAFQRDIKHWCMAVFGRDETVDPIVRAFRLLEEATEAAQSVGLTKSEASRVVDYVYARPAGEPAQEVAGCMNTLCAFANAVGVDVGEVTRIEVERIWEPEVMEKVRNRQGDKPGRIE